MKRLDVRGVGLPVPMTVPPKVPRVPELGVCHLCQKMKGIEEMVGKVEGPKVNGGALMLELLLVQLVLVPAVSLSLLGLLLSVW